MTRPGIEPRSPGPLANTLTARPMSGIYICKNICIYVYIYMYICVDVYTGARQYFSDTLKKVLQGGH